MTLEGSLSIYQQVCGVGDEGFKKTEGLVILLE